VACQPHTFYYLQTNKMYSLIGLVLYKKRLVLCVQWNLAAYNSDPDGLLWIYLLQVLQ
jgi:hypothetical protein